jgi:hypothetical protein
VIPIVYLSFPSLPLSGETGSKESPCRERKGEDVPDDNYTLYCERSLNAIDKIQFGDYFIQLPVLKTKKT